MARLKNALIMATHREVVMSKVDAKGAAQSGSQNPLRSLAERAWQIQMLVGILGVLAGLLALFWPGRTTLIVAILFGAYLLVTGVIGLFVGFTTDMPTVTKVLTILSGGLSVILGAICFRSNFQSVLLLSVWIGIGLMFKGIIALVDGLGPDRVGGGWAVLSGLMFLVGGMVLLVFPIDSLVALVSVAGVFLLIAGVIEIVHSSKLRKALH